VASDIATTIIPAASPSDATLAAAEVASSRLRHWLLQGPAQLRNGMHAGGVAGSFEQGQPSYVYAEITGYYLLWLRGLGRYAAPATVAEAAARGIAWVRREFHADAIPATRIHLAGAHADWRNEAVFFFDLAMVLRGLAAHAAQHPVADLIANLAGKLAKFVRDDTLDAVRPCADGAALPSRWSTQPGPFLLKATTAIESTHADQALSAACARQLRHSLQTAQPTAPDLLHPTLYFAEGLARCGRAGHIAARRILAGCLAHMRHDGALPEHATAGHSKHRNDVAAQALRLGLLLRQLDGHTDGDASLERLAQGLIARVDAWGQIGLDADHGSATANTWTAMFAEQALRWYAGRDGDAGMIRPELLV